QDVLLWSALAILVAAATVFAAARIRNSRDWRWVPTALGTGIAFQALMMSQSALPPARTAKPLVAQIRAFVGPNTEVFSVYQYRQSVPAYLGRTMRLVSYRGEMDFGLSREPAGFLPDLDAFVTEWARQTDAVAFIDPSVMDELRARRVPMHVRAADARSVVVTRQ
ncbi:MAG TPA: hypothetical protein VGO53_13875, partial [Steroidobacteraceae bacterium]|nr:hypothetical protein [Steroidobacteraceae bacterium]